MVAVLRCTDGSKRGAGCDGRLPSHRRKRDEGAEPERDLGQLHEAEHDADGETGTRRQPECREDQQLAALLNADRAGHQEERQLNQHRERLDCHAVDDVRRDPEPTEQEKDLEHAEAETRRVPRDRSREVERSLQVELADRCVERGGRIGYRVDPSPRKTERSRRGAEHSEDPATLKGEKRQQRRRRQREREQQRR
jgi:hypothetical protein